MRTLKTVLITNTLWTQLGFIYVLGCSCDTVGGGFPRRYLSLFRMNPSRVFSYQLSNRTVKKVDGPRRECTYGPNGLCRLSRGLSNYDCNINKCVLSVKGHAASFKPPEFHLLQEIIQFFWFFQRLTACEPAQIKVYSESRSYRGSFGAEVKPSLWKSGILS